MPHRKYDERRKCEKKAKSNAHTRNTLVNCIKFMNNFFFGESFSTSSSFSFWWKFFFLLWYILYQYRSANMQLIYIRTEVHARKKAFAKVFFLSLYSCEERKESRWNIKRSRERERECYSENWNLMWFQFNCGVCNFKTCWKRDYSFLEFRN